MNRVSAIVTAVTAVGLSVSYVRAQCWVTFSDETASRLDADAGIGADDPEEKDYAWGDLDKDGDDDLVVARKAPWSNSTGKRNVLLMNEGGVLVDRTDQYAVAADDGGQGFLDVTADRDVAIVDVDGDSWPDVVTAAAGAYDGGPKTITHPRVYVNLGNDGGGNWLGLRYEEGRIPQLVMTPNFCGIGFGDVDHDDDPDLYFTDYTNDLEDRLLENDGTGNFTDVTDVAFAGNVGFLTSQFAPHAVIADVNDDGFNDVVKNSALNPYEMKIAYNNPALPGLFSVSRVDVLCTCSDYHVSVGDLNGDGRLDLVESNDGSDRYYLNEGNGGDGFADFTTAIFPNSGDFNGNSVIADLNNDTFNDVIITDVDVDIEGCDRNTRLYRNEGNPPDVTFVEDNGGIPLETRTGGHDVAVIDLDGNGFLDVVLGTCSGTWVLMSQPIAALDFEYPGGRPDVVSPLDGATFDVQIEPVCPGEVVNPQIQVSINGGGFVAEPLAPLGGSLYRASLAATPCGDEIRYFISAELAAGGSFTDPPAAPDTLYSARSADGLEIVLADDLEGDVSAWVILSDPSLATGAWEHADPNGTISAGVLAAPEDDATPGPGVMAFVTDNGVPGGGANDNDVDGGPTHLITPPIDLTGVEARISFQRWYYNNDEGTEKADTFTVFVSNDGGVEWVEVPLLETTGTGSTWQSASFIVGAWVPPTADVRVRFTTTDNPNNSIAEGGVDDLLVERFLCAEACPWDLDGSGAVGINDLLALLGAWGSDPGGPPDFDGDGTVGINDLLALLGNWGGCP